MRETVASFRWAILPVLGVTVGLPIAVFVVGILLWEGFGVDVRALVICIVGMDALAVVWVVPLWAYYRVYIGTWGLRGYDFWGLYHEVEWAQMVAARPFNFLGLRFLRVLRTGGYRPLWVPLFLTEEKRFAALVHQYAGPAHPLTRGLLEEG